MHIGMPENKPAAQRLSNINGQDQQRGTVADKTNDHGKIDNIFQFINLENVFQKSCEKSTATNRNDCQVSPDPQGKSVVIVHVGLIQAFKPAQKHGINAPKQYSTHDDN